MWLLVSGGDGAPKKQQAQAEKAHVQTEEATRTAAEPNSLNLMGKTDSGSGESRRNENVHFNPIDNNALKDANLRLGTSASIIREFQADHNYFSAEYGNPPKVPLRVAPLKLDRFHGSAWETHMNSIFRARTFFQVGEVQPAHENQYGLTTGFVPWRNAAISLDGMQQRVRGSVNGNVLVPRLDERTPLAIDPAVRAVVQKFLDAFPAAGPNRPDIDPRTLNTNARQRIDTDSTSGRLDQGIGARDRLGFQHSFTHQQIDAHQFVAAHNPITTTRAHNARMMWTHTLSASTILQVSLGFERVHSLLVPDARAVGPKLDFINALETVGRSDIPIDRAMNRWREAFNVQQKRSKHTWSAGLEIARRQINGAEASAHNGVLYFRNNFGNDAITNLRLGLPDRLSGSIGPTHYGFRTWESYFWAGDQWRIASRLTFDIGIRWEPAYRTTEADGLIPVDFDTDWNNLAPRFGFAWHAPGKWGVIRGAYGLHFQDLYAVTLQQVRNNPPRTIKFEQTTGISIVNPFGNLPPEQLRPDARTIFVVFSPDLATPYSHQYNFSWEPQWWNHWHLQIGYVGSRSHKLLMMWYTNRARPIDGIDQITTTVNLRRPDTRYYDLRRLLNASIAYYDAARVALSVQNWHGLSFDTAYWFSKTIDLGGNYTNTATGEDARQGQSQSQDLLREDLKGLSSFDQPHAFLARMTYMTPGLPHTKPFLRQTLGGWSVSLVTLVKSGTPFTVISGSDGPGFGNVDGVPGDRPDILDPSILGKTFDDPDTSRAILARSKFAAISPTGTRGNLGFNTFRRGPIRNVNAALAREWRIAGERVLAFRAEAVNFFNTPQFAEPAKELATPSFGQITNTLNEGRTFQFTMRFRW
jgi:hypothetical protein